MEKDKMIEEMAKEIFNICAWRFGKPNDYKEICKDIAEDLINLDYCKRPKGSVVLSKEIYEQLVPLGRYKEVKSLYDKKCTELKQVRKETAKEFAEKLKESIDISVVGYSTSNVEDAIHNVAKQFGVEVEE